MSQQIYFEDVDEGMDVPTLRKDPTTQQLVKYAGASGDYYQIHYDKDFALGNGLPNVILHGALKGAWMAQIMTDWIGEERGRSQLSEIFAGASSDSPSVSTLRSLWRLSVRRGPSRRTRRSWTRWRGAPPGSWEPSSRCISKSSGCAITTTM